MLSSSLYCSLSAFCHPLSVYSTEISEPSKHGSYTKTLGRKWMNHPNLSSRKPYSTSNCLKFGNLLCSPQDPDAENLKLQSEASVVVDHDKLAHRLQSCRSIRDVQRLHCIIVKFLGDSVFVYNNLITSYIKFAFLLDARKVFDQMPDRNVVTWTAIADGYASFGFYGEALCIFIDFIENGGRANHKTFVCLLSLCSKSSNLKLGKQIHASVLKCGQRNLIVNTATADLYAKCGDLSAATCAFEQMPERDVVSWTTMISGYSQEGHYEEALSMFTRMTSEEYRPNEFTVCSVLKACAGLKVLGFGTQLHGLVVKRSFEDDVFVGTSLVDMYAECGEISSSRDVFDRMRNRNMVAWTSIIAGYALNGLGLEAISLFRIMRRRNVLPNNLTIVSILKACGLTGALLMGKEVHAQCIKNYVQSNIHISSTLIWFYCRCRERPSASKVLLLMPTRDVVSWTAMISGCAHLGHEAEALELLKGMLDEGVAPNHFTYSSALKACAKLGAVAEGKLLHSSLNKSLALSNVYVGSALVNMYAKCGYVTEASRVFDSMPERNLVSWKAMIVGYARNGLCEDALRLMYRMQAEDIEVDDYTFSTVLIACGDVIQPVNLLSNTFLHTR